MINTNTKKTILLIENDLITQEILCQFLLSQGFLVITSLDGEMGLRLAQELMPDLIISDINMPKLNGYEVLKSIRANIETASIPFIFITGEEVVNNHSLLEIEQGANAYLTKPIMLNSLLKTILELRGNS